MALHLEKYYNFELPLMLVLTKLIGTHGGLPALNGNTPPTCTV